MLGSRNIEKEPAPYAIAEKGGLFKEHRVHLLQEAGMRFAEQGLEVIVVGDDPDGEGWVRVRVIPGPEMDNLRPFWDEVRNVKRKQVSEN